MNGGALNPPVAAAIEPRVAAIRKPYSPIGLTVAWICCASCTRNRFTVSRSSSRDWRGTPRRGAASRKVGTSTTATASCASSSRRHQPSRAAVRSAVRTAAGGRLQRECRYPRGGQLAATDGRQVKAADVWPRRHSRS